jgi:ABC-2 type transport system ATP-binding protein
MIEVRGLVKRYGRLTAVAGLSLVAYPGEVLALLGPNGAGKSTTIKAMTGLLRPTAGEVKVAGFDVVREGRAAKARLGYVPDRPYLYGKLTARELLRFVAGLRGVEDAEAKMEGWLASFGLHPFANELVESYSHGMRQKLAFVAALLHEPEVLVIDEPMVGLDPRAAKQVRELIAGYAGEGKTVLLSTHSMEVAQAVAARVVVMQRGRVVAEGAMDELRRRVGREDADLEAIFLQLTEEAEAARGG